MPQPQSGYFIFTVRAVWSRERERGGEETMYVLSAAADLLRQLAIVSVV